MPVVCFTQNTTVQNSPYGTPGTVLSYIEESFMQEGNPAYAPYEDTGAMGASAGDNNTPLIRAYGLHQIPSNAENIQATFYFYTGGGFGSFTVDAKRVLKRWMPRGLSWSSLTAGVNWETSGAEGVTDVGSSVDTEVIDSGGVWENVDISAIAASDIADPLNNNGFALPPVSDVGSFRFWDTSFSGTDGQLPEIHISYDEPTGGGSSSPLNNLLHYVLSDIPENILGEAAGGGGPNPVPTPVDKDIFVFGHSLFRQTDSLSNTGFHMCDMARASSNFSAVNQIFGQLRDQTLPPPLGNNTFTNADIGSPWLSGPWSNVSWDDVFVMSSNFEEFSKTPAVFATESNAVVDYIDVNSSANIIVYQVWTEAQQHGLSVINTNEMSPSDWTTYKALNTEGGSSFDWQVDYQDEIAADGYTVYMVPVAAVIFDALINESYMTSLNHDDLFIDDAPHGNDTMYFLAGLVCYIALFGEPISGYAPVASGQIHSAVTNNLSSLISYFSTRLAYHGANNGVNLPP